MKTYSLKATADKLNRWVKPTLEILKKNGIKPAFEMKRGNRVMRLYDSKQIDEFVKEFRAARIEQADPEPTITPTKKPLSTDANLIVAINKLTAQIIDMQNVIAANTKAVVTANEMMLDQLTAPEDKHEANH